MSIPILKLVEDTAVRLTGIADVEKAFIRCQKTAPERVLFAAKLTEHLIEAGLGAGELIQRPAETRFITSTITFGSDVLQNHTKRVMLGLVSVIRCLQHHRGTGSASVVPWDDPDHLLLGFRAQLQIWQPLDFIDIQYGGLA